jgi:hypothetical protein
LTGTSARSHDGKSARLEAKPVDVVLVNPPCTDDTPAVPHEVGEPIGLCYLAAALNARGYSTKIIDGFTLGLSTAQLVELTQACAPRLCVGISVLETSALAAGRYVEKLRESGFEGHICAGNYYPTLNAERTFKLAPGLDSVLRGEGEQIFSELIDRLAQGSESWREMQGACFMLDGRFVDNGIAPQPPLDEILEPVRNCLMQTLDAGGTANLVTGRGCYANCSFCSIVTFTGAAGKRFRVRNEAAVAGEMGRLDRDFELGRFLIPDDNFMLPGRHRAPRVNAFCDALEALDLDIEFTITCRADDIHDDLIERLKSVGLVVVYLGIESFLPRRLKMFNKGLRPEANVRAIEILNRHGIFVKIGFIMYDPFVTVGEVTEELRTLRSLLDLPNINHTSIDNIMRHSTYPLELQAGTPIQKRMTSLGRTFETEAGYDYFFDSPASYALMRFAGGLLRFEGPAFAPLRALSYRLCFGNRLQPDRHARIDAACTELWKRLGRIHFETYLEAAEKLGPDGIEDPEPLIEAVRARQAGLERLRDDALNLIHSAGLADLERPWLRYVELDEERAHDRVFDPANGIWHEMSLAERAALRLWSRLPPDEVETRLARSFGPAAAAAARGVLEAKLAQGAFRGTREVDAPLSFERFAQLIEAIMADLRARKTGPRAIDVLPDESVLLAKGAG